MIFAWNVYFSMPSTQSTGRSHHDTLYHKMDISEGIVASNCQAKKDNCMVLKSRHTSSSLNMMM